jgi:dihydrolipoamide dehydrogenase
MSTKQFDSIVIGAGPGGYVCAIRLAQLGQKVAVIEKEAMGGVCLNVGCIPSKALIHAAKTYYNTLHTNSLMGIDAKNVTLDMKKMQSWKGDVVKKLTGGVGQLVKANGGEVIRGTAKLKDKSTVEVEGADGKQTLTAKNIVIATGSSIMALPTVPTDGKTILDSTSALAQESVPKDMIVIGGGYIGIELGMAYAKLGAKVTVVEAMPRILMAVDAEIASVVEKKAKKLGMELLTNTKVSKLVKSSASGAELEVEIPDKSKKVLKAEKILVAIGRVPNSKGIGLEALGVKVDAKGFIETDKQGKTNVPGLWAIGDVQGAALAHRASMDGLVVAAAIAGEKSYKDYKVVPWVIFSDPEVAGVGLSEDEAKAKGYSVLVGKFPFAANGRALSTNEGDGLIKVVLDAKTEQILGVQMVGPDVSTQIAEAALAIEMGACAEDVIRTIHSHPTLPEAFPEAVEAAFYKSIHIYKPAPKKTGTVCASPARV